MKPFLFVAAILLAAGPALADTCKATSLLLGLLTNGN